MNSEIPDFKDWHEIKKNGKEIRFPSGKSFLKLSSYVKCESMNEMYEGIGASFFGKETFKVWIGPNSSGIKTKLIAVKLNDGEWVVSIPIYEGDDIEKFFLIEEDNENLEIKINLNTKDGWKVRTIKIE